MVLFTFIDFMGATCRFCHLSLSIPAVTGQEATDGEVTDMLQG